MRGAAPTLSLRGTVPDRISVFERLFRDRPRGTPETTPAIPPELATLTTPLPMFAGRAVSPEDWPGDRGNDATEGKARTCP